MKLDKIEIARRQLGTALALFLDDADPVFRPYARMRWLRDRGASDAQGRRKTVQYVKS
jgi:hypothetical protein